MRIVGADKTLGFAQGQVDPVDDIPQEGLIALGRRHDPLPVPLVHENGVDVVGDLIAPDGVHIGIEAFADGKAVGLQRLSLPLGQGVDDLHLAAGFEHIEGNGTFHPVEVIVQAALRRDHDRRGNTGEVQCAGKLRFEEVLDELDGNLGIPQVQYGVVVFRDDQVHDSSSRLSVSMVRIISPTGGF